jgi:hypothetical protein
MECLFHSCKSPTNITNYLRDVAVFGQVAQFTNFSRATRYGKPYSMESRRLLQMHNRGDALFTKVGEVLQTNRGCREMPRR